MSGDDIVIHLMLSLQVFPLIGNTIVESRSVFSP